MNKKRKPYNYSVNEKVFVRVNSDYKLQDKWEGP